MVKHGPTNDIGGMTALTRDPSGNLASTYGLDSSIRLPRGATILSMMRITCSSLSKVTGARIIFPAFSK